MDVGNLIKTREIRLRGPHPGLAEQAALMLAEIPGVLVATAPSPYLIRVRYDLRAICLRGILQILEDWGLHLDASLWSKLRYALAFYAEDAQRETLLLPISQPEALRRLAAHVHARHSKGLAHHHGDAWDRYL
ncbi:MAG: hypothetical protein ABWU16_02105 [Halothiobacillaceae bacterium]